MAADVVVEVALSVLLDFLKNRILREAELFTGGLDIIRLIEEELELIIPTFARIESLPQLPKYVDDDVARIRDMISRAQDLMETFALRISQSKSAKYKKPIYLFKLRRITKELKRIKQKQIPFIRDQLSVFRQLNQLPSVQPARFAESKDVPFYLRHCIDYFLLFPVDFQVPARRLIVLWVAEGLVRPTKNDNEPVEHIAERYLNELVHLGVVLVTKKKPNGKVKACRLQVGTREIWLMKAEEYNYLLDKANDTRRLVDHNGYGVQVHGNPKYRNVVSFMSFNTQEGSKAGEDIGDFLHKCISDGSFLWLKVLDLEQVFRHKLPRTLGKLIGLKYLGLRWTYLEELPKFVNELLSLQVLDVKHTYISVLPKSIWRMQYLRHLYLSEAYRTRFPDRPSVASLTALQTLWGAFIDEDTCVENGLDTLRDVRKLGLSCRYHSSEMQAKMECVDRWISTLKFLESLRLKSRNEGGQPADLHLTSLEENRKLSTLYLLGKLNPVVVSEFPASLSEITLSGSGLDLDPMEFLARLPNLVILRLLGHSVTYNKMHCPSRGFHQLKVLQIWKLENLEEWKAEEGSMPSLEELEFRSCEKLKKCPHGLQYVATLKKLKLKSMPAEFRVEIEKNRAIWDKIEPLLEEV